MNLQKVLNSSADTQVAVTGAGSPGHESSYFGGLTKVAVIKFQNKYAAQILTPVGLTSGTGLVGVSTRALLNNQAPVGPVSTCAPGQVYNPATGALCTVTGPVNSGPVSVSLANSVSYGALVSPSATAQLASFTFTGTGVVSNVNLQRTGVSSDQTLTNVYLYDGATRLTDAASVSSGNISFNNPAGLFVVSGSRTVTVRADIASSQGGATVGVALANYAVVGGSPVVVNLAGNIQNIASNISAATVQVQTNTVGAQSVNAGATNLTVWSAPVNVGTRSVYLQAVSFKFIGSAPTNSLTNTQLLVDGAVVGNGSIDQNSVLTFNLSAAPLTLNTGSHTLSVQTNVVAGAYRSFQLSLQNSGDLMVADSQLQGVNVAPYTTSTTNGGVTTYTFSTNNGGLITINNGTVSVQIDPAFTPTTVTGGATNVPIAQFKFTSYGEDVKVNSLAVEPQITAAIGGAFVDSSLNNVALYVNGGQVGSTYNDASTTVTFGTNNLFTIPAGQTVIVTVKADTISAQNTSYTTGNIHVVLPYTLNTVNSGNAQGVQSSQIVSVGGGLTSNSISIGSGSPTVAVNTALSNFTTSPNVSNVKIGSFVIQASSAEGLRVNNIVVTLNGGLGATNPSLNFANIKIVTPAGTATPVSPQTTNSFSTNGFTIPVNQTATIDVYADVLGNSGTASTSISVSAQGAVSNTSVTGTAIGQNFTVGTGFLYAPTLTSTSPVAQYVVSGNGGSNSFNAATYNFISTTSPATIQELHFAIGGTSNNSVTAVTVSGPGMTTPVTANVVSGTATVTGLSIVIPVGYAGGNVVVTPTFAPVGLNGLTSPYTSTITLNYVKALVGSNTVTPAGVSVVAPASSSFSLVASKPTITISNPGSALTGGSVRIARITVSADAAGPVAINQIPLAISANGGTTLASQILVVEDTNGNVITGATSIPTGAISSGNPGSSNVTFASPGYRIEAGQSMSFDIYATTGGSLSTSGSSNVVTSLSSSTGSLNWTDINGASGIGSLHGTLLTNYPTNTSTLSN
jgi:hypothetical protein